MAIFVEDLNGEANGTDMGAVGSFVRNTGTAGSVIVNADGHMDIVSVTPNSKITYPVVQLDNSMECATAQASITGNYYPVGVSCTSGGNGLYARIVTGNNIELAKIVSDTITTLVGSGGTIINATYPTGTRATGDRLKIERIGDTVKVFFNDVEKFSVDVSAQGVARSANCGMYIRSTTGTDLFTSFTMEGIAAQNITDINGGDPVDGDSSGNTFTTTGFTEDITDVEIDGLACTNVDETAGSGTFDVPPPVDGEVYPELGVNQDVTISGATQSAILAKMFELGTYSIVELVDPELEDLTYPTAHFDFEPVSTDLMIPEEGITATENGGVTLPAPAIKTIMHWVRATGVMYIYSFEINQDGVVPNSIVARHIVASGIVARSIAARGI